MEAEIAELEKTGATEIAGKLREAWKTHTTQLDTLKADHSGASKKLTALEREAAKYKADLENAGKGTDERITALTRERDEFKTAAEQRAADLESHKLRVKLADKFGISDPAARESALDDFLRSARPEGAGFDANGEIQGFDKAIETFRKGKSFYFGPPDGGNGGSRSGADPKPKPTVQTKPSTEEQEVNEWSKTLYPKRHEGAAK